MTQRLLAIGLDGYETTFADQLIAAGRLPNLRVLREEAALLELDHDRDRNTGLAWEHFATGLDPVDAGRQSPVNFDPDSYRCQQVTTRLRPFPAALDLDTAVFDAPYFDLSGCDTIRGVVNWGAHDPGVSTQARPAGLLAEIQSKFGPYPATDDIYGYVWPSVTRTQRMGRALSEAARLRGEIARWLFGERLAQWSLGIVVSGELHSATEALWHGVDPDHPLAGAASAPAARSALESCYAAVDEMLGQLRSAFPDAALLAFSMHGMGPNRSDVPSMVMLPEWLYRRRFGTSHLHVPAAHGRHPERAPAMSAPDWSAHLRRSFEDLHRPTHRARAKLADLLRGRPSSAPDCDAELPLDWMPANWYQPYWARMDAFALPSYYDGQIRVNLAGREASGRVPAERYSQLLDELETELRACRDPRTGHCPVRETERRGGGDPFAVGSTEGDLVVRWTADCNAWQTPNQGLIGPVPSRRTGGHTGGHGAAMLHARGIPAGHFGLRSAHDLAPTIAEFVSGQEPEGFSGHSCIAALRQAATAAAH